MEVTDQLSVRILAKYNLTSTKILRIKLIPNSNYLSAIDDQNYQFLIKWKRNSADYGDDDDDNDYGIKKIISLPMGYIDYSAIETNDGLLHILLLFVKNDPNISNCFSQYVQIQTPSNYCHQMQTVHLSNATYNAMQFQYYDTQRFVLAAKLTDIHLLELIPCESGSKIDVNLMQTISTTHSFGCCIHFSMSAASFLTYGDDGQCHLWDKNSMRMVKSILAHDKCQRGVRDAVLDSMQR